MAPAAAKVHYMGNVETGITTPFSKFMSHKELIWNLQTTHGVEINPYLFTGVGVGVWMMYEYDSPGACMPIYADVRGTLPFGKWRPFADFRIGCLAGNACGFTSPTLGCKFAWGRRAGVYLGIGTDIVFGNYQSHWTGLAFRLGFDF